MRGVEGRKRLMGQEGLVSLFVEKGRLGVGKMASWREMEGVAEEEEEEEEKEKVEEVSSSSS